MQAVLDELAALDGKPIEKLSSEEARKQPTPADAMKRSVAARPMPWAPPVTIAMRFLRSMALDILFFSCCSVTVLLRCHFRACPKNLSGNSYRVFVLGAAPNAARMAPRL